MKAKIRIENTTISVDLSEPIDISIPLKSSSSNPIAWNLGLPRIEPVQIDDWIGKVSEGASVNFNTITFNPHAHGTHTECVGHITAEFHSVNDLLKRYIFLAEVISVTPKRIGEDVIITKDEIMDQLKGRSPEALIVRTIPNDETKRSNDYTNTNWPYLEESAAKYIRDLGVDHLLIDTPSVDKESDEGRLLAHKAFWNYPDAPRLNSTITELIYVPDQVKDDRYLLSLQIASFHNDACPSKPVLYKLDDNNTEF